MLMRCARSAGVSLAVDRQAGGREQLFVEGLCWGFPSECLARAAVERGSDRGEVVGAVSGEVGSFREVLPQEAVGVLVAAALPRALRVTEIHLQASVDLQLSVPCHLGALVPGERPAQLSGQRRDRSGDGVTDGVGAVTGERGTVLGSRATVAAHRRQVQQHREMGAALDERPDRGAAQAEDQITLPVPGNRAVLRFGGTLADQDLVGHKALAATAGAGSGRATPSRSAGTR